MATNNGVSIFEYIDGSTLNFIWSAFTNTNYAHSVSALQFNPTGTDFVGVIDNNILNFYSMILKVPVSTSFPLPISAYELNYKDRI